MRLTGVVVTGIFFLGVVACGLLLENSIVCFLLFIASSRECGGV